MTSTWMNCTQTRDTCGSRVVKRQVANVPLNFCGLILDTDFETPSALENKVPTSTTVTMAFKKKRMCSSDTSTDIPPKPLFQTLPPELIHLIFSYIDETEAFLALRKTCSLFASVGLDHFPPEIPLVFHRDKFKALTEIATHPKLSKQMRSLFYVVDRCRQVKYETWDSHRPDPEPWVKDDVDCSVRLLTKRDVRVFQRDVRKAVRKQEERIASVPESERRKAYEVFTALCKDVIKVEDEGYDYQCLKALFEGCRNINEVTIGSRVDIRRRMEASRKIVKGAMAIISQDRKWWKAGIRQVLSVAMAASQAGTKLDSLTLAAISPLLFDKGGNIREDEWCALKALVQPLRRLRLFSFAEPPDREDRYLEFDDDDPGVEQTSFLSDDILEAGHLRELLSAAKDLRVLKLQLPNWDYFTGEGPIYTLLAPCLQDITWPHLYELSLSCCAVPADFLVDLCLRHKATLRRLSLYNIQLMEWENGWKEVLTRLSGHFPELRQVKLRGTFYVSDEYDFSFDIAGFESRRTAPFRDALEDFVVKGGDWPSEDPEVLPDRGDYPDEDYEPPWKVGR